MTTENHVNTITRQRVLSSTPLSIDVDSMSYIYDTFINLYPNPVLAVLREYSSNGLDAHRKIGQTVPIEVFLPSEDSPYYIVRDYGIGMSEEELRTVYARYGKSTKRDSEEEVGKYGLGCKCAFTIASEFTIKTVQDGIHTEAVMGLDSQRNGSLDIVRQYETQEEDGTTVTIPVTPDYFNKFIQYSGDFFASWAEGSVLVDGEPPTRTLKSEGYHYVKDIGWWRKNLDGGKLSVVMGGINYAVRNLPTEVQYNIAKHHNIDYVLEAAIDGVDLVQSREDVKITNKTESFILEQSRLLADHVEAALREEVEQAPTRIAAMIAQGEVSSYRLPTHSKTILWQGEEIPEVTEFRTSYSRSRYDSRIELKNYTSFRFPTAKSSACFVPLTKEEFAKKEVAQRTSSMVRKLTDCEGTIHLVLETEEILQNKWFQASVEAGFLKIFTLADLKKKNQEHNAAVRAMRVARGVAAPTGSMYTVLTVEEDDEGGQKTKRMETTAEKIRGYSSQNLYYVRLSSKSGSGGIATSTLYEVEFYCANNLPVGTQVVVLRASQREETFLKRIEGQKIATLQSLFCELGDKAFRETASYGEDEQIRERINAKFTGYHARILFSVFSQYQYSDPELQKAFSLGAADMGTFRPKSSLAEHYKKSAVLWKLGGLATSVIQKKLAEAVPNAEAVVFAFDKYPLLTFFIGNTNAVNIDTAAAEELVGHTNDKYLSSVAD